MQAHDRLQRFRLVALVRSLETVVQEAGSQREIAWIAESPSCIATHPSGRTWGGAGFHLCLFTLEGGEHIERCGQTDSLGITGKVEEAGADKAIEPNFWQRLWARTRQLLRP
jgi:hypothetical protein